MLVAPVQRGKAEGAVERTEEGFRPGLNKRGDGDGEFAYAQPARAARYVSG